jgi:dynein heavy chain, axonemal
MSMQGTRWDSQIGMSERSKLKEMFFRMPVINVKALATDKVETNTTVYTCPSYKTTQRGPTFVFCVQLKTKANSGKWMLAGVAMIFDVSSIK